MLSTGAPRADSGRLAKRAGRESEAVAQAAWSWPWGRSSAPLGLDVELYGGKPAVA